MNCHVTIAFACINVECIQINKALLIAAKSGSRAVAKERSLSIFHRMPFQILSNFSRNPNRIETGRGVCAYDVSLAFTTVQRIGDAYSNLLCIN